MSMYNRSGGCYISDNELVKLYGELLLSNKIKVGGPAHNRMNHVKSRIQNRIKGKMHVTKKKNTKISKK